jgi:hypothetical protein
MCTGSKDTSAEYFQIRHKSELSIISAKVFSIIFPSSTLSVKHFSLSRTEAKVTVCQDVTLFASLMW